MGFGVSAYIFINVAASVTGALPLPLAAAGSATARPLAACVGR